ncbi:MAG: septum formation initiator family protein [Balneolaceae bacterium]|nr:septum formation initiator family protein [Balneolaceae bacterium]
MYMKGKRTWLIGLLAAFVAVWFLFFDTHSLMTKIKLENQKKDLIERTEEYQLRTAELEQKIKDLETSPDLLEKIAREDYGMRKPDETVYKIKVQD